MNKFAIVFPGQGSQSLGMLADIAAEHSEVKQTFDQASSVLGYDLWELVQNGPAESLDKTEHTQPALLAASYAIWQILKNNSTAGVCRTPSFLAGHSLGEYTALVCANALDFTDAVKLVAARGRYMQEAVPAGMGSMAAIIGLDENAIERLCKESVYPSEILAPANFNSIGQVVIAGHKTAVERAIEAAKNFGAKMAISLPVSVPSHCQLMMPAAECLKLDLEKIAFRLPNIPVINNVDVTAYDNVDAIRKGLTRQLFMPVRWVDTIQFFVNQSVTQVIECGPGKVLTGLNKRIDKQLQLMATADVSSLNSLLHYERSA